jgi:hypothetical protein
LRSSLGLGRVEAPSDALLLGPLLKALLIRGGGPVAGASSSLVLMSYLRWKRARYAVPAAVLAAVGLGALVPTLSGASAPPDLPAQTAQQLVADMAAAKPPQLSGAVTWTANLGLSDLSSLEQETGQGGGNGNGFDPLTLLSGNYHLDVWLGTKAEHIALIEPSDQEVDIVRNNNQAWIWDSSTQNVLHLIGANSSSKSSGRSAGLGIGSGLSALPLTPMELASRLLGHLTTSTAVSVGSPVYVAGQPAYQLVVGPKGAKGSSIRSIAVAIGAAGPLLGVPLQVAVYANGQASPALELGFTGQLNTGAPPASKLTFTPPPGSTVVTRTVGAGTSGSALGISIPLIPLTRTYGAAGTEASSPMPPALGSGLGQLSKSGTGWATVVSGSSGLLFGSIAAGPLSAVTRVVTVHGQQGRLFSTELLNVLIMQNGHYYAGFVTPSVLEAAASASS